MSAWWTLEVDGRQAVLEVTGEISDASDLTSAIQCLDADEITLRIDSTGGSATALVAAMALAAHPAHRKVAELGRHADSAALLLALGADHRTCRASTTAVVHASQPGSARTDRSVAAWLALRTAPAAASAEDVEANVDWWLEVMHENDGEGRVFRDEDLVYYHAVHDVTGGWVAPGPLDEIAAGVAELPADLDLGATIRETVEAELAGMFGTR